MPSIVSLTKPKLKYDLTQLWQNSKTKTTNDSYIREKLVKPKTRT